VPYAIFKWITRQIYCINAQLARNISIFSVSINGNNLRIHVLCVEAHSVVQGLSENLKLERLPFMDI
jgi:hypothetical protein